MTVTDRLTGLASSAAIKVPCRVATTANLTLSALQTIDGVALAAEDRVLVKDQTDQSENGIWVADTGDWNRATDFDGANDVVDGTICTVLEGTTNSRSAWVVTTDDPVTPGTSDIVFAAGLFNDAAAIYFIQTGTDAIQIPVQTELRKIVRASQFDGADFGEQLTAALAIMPSTGGIIDCTDTQGAQTASANITIDKPVKIYLGGMTLALGTNRILITDSAASIFGIGKQDENNSPTKITYSGTTSAIKLQHPTTATALFGNRLEDFEIAATGSAVASATAIGIASYGTRYSEFRNVQVYNFTAGIGLYYTGNGAVSDGFGATNNIYNPTLSTNKYSIWVDSAGGSASTHGCVYGGYAFGSTTAFDSACESWRFINTDFGGTPCIKLRAGADDTVIMAGRFEAYTSAIVIDATVARTQIIAPSFIDTTPGTEITDNGDNTQIIGSMPGSNDNKMTGVQGMVFYSSEGETASLAPAATANILDTSDGGVWLLSVIESGGATTWRASAVIISSGAAITVQSLNANNVTVGSSGATLQLSNAGGSDKALKWNAIKLLGARAYP